MAKPSIKEQITKWQPSEAVRKANPHLYNDPLKPLATERLAKDTGAKIEKRTNVRGGRKEMNKTEARFFAILEARQRRGEFDSVRREGMRLQWGRDEKTGQAMWYKPDFVVMKLTNITGGKPDFVRETTIIEVKGAHIRERDLVRFKGCRAEWPEFTFEMHQWAGGEWRQIL